MEMKMYLSVIVFALLAACTTHHFDTLEVSDVYVQDFGSDDIKRCKPSDVDLSHHEAKEFFQTARQVAFDVIHNHYEYAPCYIEGTLTYRSKVCDWEIRAGATGHIKCGDEIKYFVCDTCESLFTNF